KRHMASARASPAIQRTSVRLNVGTTNVAKPTQGPLESRQHLRHTADVGLIDPSLNAALALARPALAVEEPRCPRELVPIHSRVKNTSAGLLSVPRPSHVHATSAAISRYRVQSSMSFLPAKPASRSCQ